MSTWSDETPREQRPKKPNQEELRHKQVAFLQAIHAFSQDPEIKRLTDERREAAVAALVALTDTVQPRRENRRGQDYTRYIVDITDEVAQYFNFPRDDIPDFFRKIGEANGHKPVKEWDRKEIENKARERFDSGVFHIRDIFEKLAKEEKLTDKLRHQISNTLQDIAMRDPREREVTTGNVGDLLSAVSLPEHCNQDRFWTNLKQDLQEASTSLGDGSKLKGLVDTVAQAGERSGLFREVDNLLGGKERK